MPSAWPTGFLGCILGTEAATLTIYRWPVGNKTYVNGRMVVGAPTLILGVEASVQPLTQQEWLKEGLGGRLRDYYKIYTEETIVSGGDTPDPGTGGWPAQEPDWINWEGRFYQAVQVNTYRAVYPHTKAIIKNLQLSRPTP